MEKEVYFGLSSVLYALRFVLQVIAWPELARGDGGSPYSSYAVDFVDKVTAGDLGGRS